MRWLSRVWPRKRHAPDMSSIMTRFNQRLQARYDSASPDGDMERWWSQADYRSPRAANSQTVRKLIRSRARYECLESNSVAKRIVMAKAGDVIGPDGPMLQVTTENPEFNKEVEAKWNDWVDRTGFVRKLRTAYQAKIVDGEAFIERILNPQLPDDGPQLDIAVTEAEMWTNPLSDNQPNEDDGIFFDNAGNPRKYYRLKVHPGDDRQFSSGLEFDTLDASNVIHWFRADRPGQTRGISEFAPALSLFAQLRRYRLAVLAAAETAAEFAGVIYNDGSAYSEMPDPLDETLRINIERRILMSLPAGWKMAQLKAEQPTADFDQFSDSIYKEVGGVLRTPLNIVTGSSRDYNFASGRLDYILYWQACDEDRSDCKTVVMRRVKNWWLEEAMAIPGYLPPFGEFMADTLPHAWLFPARRPIDELKQAQADEIKFNLGWMTDEDYAVRESMDPEALFMKQSRMIERRKAMGMSLPGGNGNPQQGTNQGTESREDEESRAEQAA